MNGQSQKINNLHDEQMFKVAGFIRKLFNILNSSIYSKAICWNEDGKSVKILNSKQLESKVLSCNFRHRNYHSFIRQLNMYGFRKMERTVVNKVCSFAHPLFQKDNENKLYLIKTKHQAKRIERQEKLLLIGGCDQKNSVENLEGEDYFLSLGKQFLKTTHKESGQFSSNIIQPSKSQKQNSTKISTKQTHQQRKSFEQSFFDKKSNKYQLTSKAESVYSKINQPIETFVNNNFGEQCRRNRSINKEQNINSTLNDFGETTQGINQPNFNPYQTPINFNTSFSLNAPIQKLLFQKDSSIGFLPSYVHPFVQNQVNLQPTTIPHLNGNPCLFSFQPTSYSQMTSSTNYIQFNPYSYFQAPPSPMISSMGQVCRPQFFYNANM